MNYEKKIKDGLLAVISWGFVYEGKAKKKVCLGFLGQKN